MADGEFSSTQAAALCGLCVPSIRALARTGVVGKKKGAKSLYAGRWRFGFSDVRVLRSAYALLASGLKYADVERALVGVKAQVGAQDQPLSGAALGLYDGRIIARDGRLMWDAQTGQVQLWYAPQDAHAQPVLPPLEEPPAPAAADASLALPDSGGTAAADALCAQSLAAQDPEAAYRGYLQALACDPEHLQATLELGALCVTAQDLPRAVGYFRWACHLAPTHVLAQVSLARALQASGRQQEAMGAYRAALGADPACADAKKSLNLLCEVESVPH